VAATGALYIFKDEVEGVLHPGVLYVDRLPSAPPMSSNWPRPEPPWARRIPSG